MGEKISIDSATPHRLSNPGDEPAHAVALHEDGVEAGDRADGGSTGAFEDFGQEGEDRGRVTFGCGRFADGQADLALRLGHAGKRVEQEQDVLAHVAEIFGDGASHACPADALCTAGASATVALSATSTLISTCGIDCIGAANSASDERVCAIRDISRRPVRMPSPVVPIAGMTMWPDCSPPSEYSPARSSSST